MSRTASCIHGESWNSTFQLAVASRTFRISHRPSTIARDSSKLVMKRRWGYCSSTRSSSEKFWCREGRQWLRRPKPFLIDRSSHKIAIPKSLEGIIHGQLQLVSLVPCAGDANCHRRSHRRVGLITRPSPLDAKARVAGEISHFSNAPTYFAGWKVYAVWTKLCDGRK